MEKTSEEKLKDVENSYLKSFLYVGADIFIAIVIACFINCCFCYYCIGVIAKISRVLGLLIIGGAVMGRLGWGIQTWEGKNPEEKRNIELFRWCYFIGIFFTALSIFL